MFKCWMLLSAIERVNIIVIISAHDSEKHVWSGKRTEKIMVLEELITVLILLRILLLPCYF